METIQLSEDTFCRAEGSVFRIQQKSPIQSEHLNVFLSADEFAALTEHLTAKVLGEIEAGLRIEMWKEEPRFTRLWNDGKIEGIVRALSLIRSRLPERKEDGKV